MLAMRIRSFGRTGWLAFFAAILLAWMLLIQMAVPADLRAYETRFGAAALEFLCAGTPGDAGILATIAMWALMSAAMMAPTALPAFATYGDLSAVGRTAPGHLVAGYLLAWLGFSVVAAAAQTALTELGLIGSFGQSVSSLLTMGLLIGAGLYQFSAIKAACLSRCRAPLTFFMAHWDEGALRNGLRMGLDCIGCCWALMGLAFVGGTMNLGFMAVAMVLMTLEKLPDIGRHLTRPLGAILIAAGIIHPFL